MDAAYSTVLDRVILISANPNQLHVYDPVGQTDQTVALPAAPQNVCISPDGTHAGVGFSNSVVYVDVQALSISNTFSNVTVGTGQVICGSGYLYVFPKGDTPNKISIDIATGQITLSSTGPFSVGGTFDQVVNAIYSAADGSPGTLYHFDTSAGTVGSFTSQPSGYFAVFSICGPLWLSHDGSTVYSACGTIFRASTDPTKDMRYLGLLAGATSIESLATSDSLSQVALIPAVPTYLPMPYADTVVNLYSSVSFDQVGQFATTPFEVNSKSFAAHGRWVFYNSSSTSMFIITQADSSAGLLQDYAIENVNLTNANSCNAAFASASASAIAPGSHETTQIQSVEDCVFTAVSNVPWITLTSGYYGSGKTTLTYLVRPNLSGTPRLGTISLGSQTFTVNQDGAGPQSSTTPLSFKPVAAWYDKPLDKIVMISSSPNELHIYDPVTQADQIVSLLHAPLSLSVRPDGLAAAVGYSGSISIVDLQADTVAQTIAVDMDNSGIVIASNGYAYAFPQSVLGNMNSIQLSTDSTTPMSDTLVGNIPRLDVSGSYLYVGGNNTSKLNISNGPATFVTNLLTTFSGNIWLSEDGNRLITSAGKVYFTSPVPSQDMQPDGQLSATSLDWAADSQVQNQIAVLTDPSSTINTQLQIYAANGLQLKEQQGMPGFTNNSQTYVSHGKYLFWNAAESKLFAITEADSTSGLLSDFTVNTIAMPESLPNCTYAISPASLNAPASYSTWVFNVTSSCTWTPSGSSTWLNFSSIGPTTGNGQIIVSVGNNSGGARSATVTVGTQAVTINQAPSSCVYSLSSLNVSFTESGGTGSVNLTTGANCSWSVQSNESWLTAINQSGSGPAPIVFSVAPEGASRSFRYGTLNVAGWSFTVSQTSQMVNPRVSSFTVWRPANGTWYVLETAATNSYPNPTFQQQWGLPTDTAVPGDYDGDGKTDYAVWRPSNGTWYIMLSTNPSAPIVQQWGVAGDVPVPGDYDGDGKIDVAVWRPSNGTWYIIPSSNPGSPIIQQWGLPGDMPVVGDFNGDGKTDFAVWRSSTGTWFVLYSNATGSYPNASLQQQWGLPGDTPLVGDFNADGKADFAVWRPATGTWYVLYNGATSSYPNASLEQQWGLPGDTPLVGDFNGDGKVDFAVWRPFNGSWYVLYNGAASSYPTPSLLQQWGVPGDVPIAANY